MRISVGLDFKVVVVLTFIIFVDEGKVFLKLHSLDLLQQFQIDYSLCLTVTNQATFKMSGHQCHPKRHHSSIPDL